MASGSLKGAEFFCAGERERSLKCAGEAGGDSAKVEACQALFDEYKACKKRAVDERNLKNRGGQPKTFF